MMKKYEDNPRFIGAKSKQNPSKPMGVLDHLWDNDGHSFGQLQYNPQMMIICG
jgi:hypothetical protein